MNICDWDWGVIAGFSGAIATLLTGFIALYISSQWKQQKRSEILSNEAAKILDILEDYREKLVSLDHEMMKPSRNDNKDKLEELRQIARQLRNRATLFGELANNDDVAEEIRNIAAAYYSKANHLKEMKDNPKNTILVLGFDGAIKQSKDIIIDYFKHQKN